MAVQDPQKVLAQLQSIARAAKVTVEDRGHGHFQLNGLLQVNYWPFSRKRTAYVSGTVKGHEQVSPQKAVAMANQLPKLPAGTLAAKRKKKSRAIRLDMWERGYRACYRCKQMFQSFEETTLEHVIPLARGGLEHFNNRALSHLPCNQERGNEMPELGLTNHKN